MPKLGHGYAVPSNNGIKQEIKRCDEPVKSEAPIPPDLNEPIKPRFDPNFNLNFDSNFDSNNDLINTAQLTRFGPALQPFANPLQTDPGKSPDASSDTIYRIQSG
ncbi:MAG: hypothetical protein KME16_00030 [Scytolyngbya sp. HA4215-MV1]|jgi:hypothetical protein|nr:hypothetical protein [Scytolyngbya sp. HA4215-MV1]